MTALSPYHNYVDFPNGITLDQKIDVFAARVQGWQIDPAERLIRSDMHSGFAVLSILVSYFEMIGKFEDGFVQVGKDGRSRDYFKKGFQSVFELELERLLAHFSRDEIEKALDLAYESLRCGMYHVGVTGKGISISSEYDLIQVYPPNFILLNPHKLPTHLKSHFHQYVRRLRIKENEGLRNKFEKTFNWLSSGKFFPPDNR